MSIKIPFKTRYNSPPLSLESFEGIDLSGRRLKGHWNFLCVFLKIKVDVVEVKYISIMEIQISLQYRFSHSPKFAVLIPDIQIFSGKREKFKPTKIICIMKCNILESSTNFSSAEKCSYVCWIDSAIRALKYATDKFVCNASFESWILHKSIFFIEGIFQQIVCNKRFDLYKVLIPSWVYWTEYTFRLSGFALIKSINHVTLFRGFTPDFVQLIYINIWS